MDELFNILVVDDEPIGRQLLEAVLYPEGYEITFAENGKEAYNKAVSEQPDLIMLDVMMPDMDGFETCKKIRETQKISGTPVFLITALDDRDSRLRGLDAGADDYISKPFDRIEILAKVKNVKQNRKSNTEVVKETDNAGSSETQLPVINKVLFDIYLNPADNIGAFAKNYFMHCNNDYNYRGYGTWSSTLGNSKYFAFFSANLENAQSASFNFYVSALLQKFLNKTEANLIIDEVTKNLEKTGYNLSSIDFSIVLLQKKESSESIKFTGINGIVYLKSNITANNTQPYYLSDNHCMELPQMNQIVLLTKNFSDILQSINIVQLLDQNSYHANVEFKNLFQQKTGNLTGAYCAICLR